jgi:hypothetical protein
MLAYLGRATKHHHEREFARQKLKIELSRLKKVSTKSMKRYIHDLERSISEAITKEQHILKHQKHEDVIHGDIRDRVKELEARLSRYLAIHEMRARRVKLLEDTLVAEKQTKGEQLAIIKRSLARAERIYQNARKDKKHSKKQLAATKKTLDAIRVKVQELEKKYQP